MSKAVLNGILKQISKTAFSCQDIAEFDSLARILREKILMDLEPFYAGHLALYITQKCLEDPDISSLIYCVASHCFWQDGKWISLELYKSGTANL